jgi:hypothetical protein
MAALRDSAARARSVAIASALVDGACSSGSTAPLSARR